MCSKKWIPCSLVASTHDAVSITQACRFYATLLIGGLQISALHAQPVFNVNPDGTISTWASGGAPDGHVVYHPQVTAFFCGAATMEMELDCTAIRSGNLVINEMLGAGVAGAVPGAAVVDGAPKPVFPGRFTWTPPGFTIIGGVSVPTSGVQSFIYGLVHGINTWNGLTYLNPYYPLGLGTSLDDVAAGLNLMDSTVHNYASYNVGNIDYANRTMAAALANPILGIPAAATVQHGAHWICVVGVKTDVKPVLNGKFTILGFYVQDPWTGYQKVNPNGPNGKALPPGLAENKFCGYKVNAKRVAGPQDWDGLFNLAGGPPLPLYGAGLGYKFEVEPIGPEALDNGDGGLYTSIPAPSPILADAPLTAAEAQVIGANDIAADTYISSQAGFSNGTWNVSDATLVQYPTDGPNEGDWLVPYEGAGGASDVTGFVLIDMETGDLDEAVWMDPGDAVPSMTLADVDTMETDEYDGIFPDDNAGEAQLNIQLNTPDTVLLSWQDSDLITYSLQQTSSLSPTNWMTLTNTPTVVSNIDEVILPISALKSFYRLTAP
jgi:hypothetical protein